MKYVVLIARILFGLPLVAFSIMGLVNVMPDPQAAWADQPFHPKAKEIILMMWDSGYLMLCVIAVHLVSGILAMINRYVPFALAIHLPVSIQMLLLHLVYDPGTGGFAYLVVVLNFYLLYKYRGPYKELLAAKATPD